MTTQAPTQPQVEFADDPNVWRVLGRLEANQETMMQRLDRVEAKLDRLLYIALGIGGSIIVALIGVIAAILAA